MSLSQEKRTLWTRLRAAGVVSSELPAPGDGLPWYLAGLIGVSAWIATGLLFGFFTTLFDDLWTRPGVAATAGALCVVAALALLRIARRPEFFEQLAIALSLVGQLLLAISFQRWLDDIAGWAGSAAIAVLLYVSGARAMHRFLCGAVFATALVAICNELDTVSYGTSPFALPLLACLAFATWWRADYEDLRALPASPLAWALSLGALVIAVTGDVRWAPDQNAAWLLPWIPQIAIAALLPLLAWRLAGVRRWLPLLCAIAFALIWLRAPGVSVGVMLMLIAFASSRTALLATGLIGTAVYLVSYYYQLDVPLLEKSYWLLLGGAGLLAIRFVLTRAARGDRA